jgi:hypothetical protein
MTDLSTPQRGRPTCTGQKFYKEVSGHEPQTVFDTLTNSLAAILSKCDFEFGPHVEACGKMDVVTEACSSCGSLWRCGRCCYGRVCVDRRIEVAVPAAIQVEEVDRLHPDG